MAFLLAAAHSRGPAQPAPTAQAEQGVQVVCVSISSFSQKMAYDSESGLASVHAASSACLKQAPPFSFPSVGSSMTQGSCWDLTSVSAGSLIVGERHAGVPSPILSAHIL